MKVKYICVSLCLLVTFFGAGNVTAQNFLLSLNFLTGDPKGEFDDNVENLGFGFSGMFGYHPDASAVMIGGELAFMRYGSETRNEPFSTTIPDVRVDVETSNDILLLHALVRMQGNQGSIRPYLDGLVGFNYLVTQTKIKNEGVEDEVIASSTNLEDVVFSYGAGGGLMIRVKKKSENGSEGSKQTEILLDFRVRYLFGGEADYLKEGSIRRDSGNVEFDITRSRTDLLTFNIGVAFTF